MDDRLQQAVATIERRHYGQYRAIIHADGTVGWVSTRAWTGNRNDTWISQVELQSLQNELRAEMSRPEYTPPPPTRWQQATQRAAGAVSGAVFGGGQRQSPAQQSYPFPANPSAGAAGPAGGTYQTNRTAGSVQCWNCGNFVSAHDVPRGRCTFCGAPLQRPDGDQAGQGRGSRAWGAVAGAYSGIRGFAASSLNSLMQGGAIGGIAAGLTGSAVSGLSAPLMASLQAALSPLGASGGGVMQIGRSVIELVSAGIRAATTVGASVIGSALMLVLGPALGGMAAGAAGMLAGLLGGLFAQVGRTLGEAIGGIVQIMQDVTRAAMQASETVMRLSSLMGTTAQSSNQLVSSLRVLGMGAGEASSMFGSFGNRMEFVEARFAGLGIAMARNKDGTIDWARQWLNVSDWMTSQPAMMQRPMLQAALGPGADKLYPILSDRNQVAQMASQMDALMPRTEALQAAWSGLRTPIAELGLLWDTLKVEFVSGFVPMMIQGAENILGWWRDNGGAVLDWFAGLPSAAVATWDAAKKWLTDMWAQLSSWYNEWKPKFDRFWKEFRDDLAAIVGLSDRVAKMLGLGGGGGGGTHTAGAAGGGDYAGGGGGYATAGGGADDEGGGGGDLGYTAVKRIALGALGLRAAGAAAAGIWGPGWVGKGLVGAGRLVAGGAARIAPALFGGRALGSLGWAGRGLALTTSGLGLMAGVAGTTMAGVNAYRAYQHGAETGEVASTRSKLGGMGWGALGGAGIGLMLGGPVGALFGAAIGSIVGVVASHFAGRAGAARYARAAQGTVAPAAEGEQPLTPTEQFVASLREVWNGVQERGAETRAQAERRHQEYLAALRQRQEVDVKIKVDKSREFDLQVERNEALKAWSAIQEALA